MSAQNTAPTTTSGETAGATAGDKVKGLFNTVHGGLEKLRGEALSAADAAGDQVKENPSGGSSASEVKNANTAAKGESEFNQGLGKLNA